MKRTYSIYYLTIFILSLRHQLSHCASDYTNYTFTAMGDNNKIIPNVCWLTLHCPGARNHTHQCIDMDDNDNECTLDASDVTMETFCAGSSIVTVDSSITVAIEEENSNMNIIFGGTTLMCTPIVSCDIMNNDTSIMWDVFLLNGTNNTMSNGTSLPVKARQYGNYTCNVITTTRIMRMKMANITYALYGGPRFSDRNKQTRATLHDYVEFTCDFTSHPPFVNITWFKDGVNNLKDSSNKKTIIFEEVDYDDEATYTCQVFNLYNGNSKNFQLKVRSPLTPLWPAIGIIAELSLVAIIIIAHEWYKKRQQKKDNNNRGYNPTFDELKKRDEEDDTEAYNFPTHSINYSQHERQRIGSITKENLLPDSVQ